MPPRVPPTHSPGAPTALCAPLAPPLGSHTHPPPHPPTSALTHLRAHPSPQDHPHGFVAKPQSLPDGTQNILKWDVVIPGKVGTSWEGANIPMTMEFSDDYPSKPPKCSFKLIDGKPLFHPNVYPSGKICLSIINDTKDGTWRAALTIKQVLIAVQVLLEDVNNGDPAQEEAYRVYRDNKIEYKKRVRLQVARLQALV